ncbi:MAG: motility associated factor glycosyltransferase family protein [Sandaracinaceae bacterium]
MTTASPALTVRNSVAGPPTLLAGDHPLEDPVDPEAGAQAFIAPEQLAERHHVVLFGAGLGYRARRLVDLGVDPIVFEPSVDVLALAGRHGPGLPEGCTVFDDVHALQQHLARETVDGQETVLLTPPPYARAFPEALHAVTAVLSEVQGIAKLKRNTISDRSSMLVERVIENLPRLESVPLMETLGRPLEGVPAFLVAAGPSLDKNRHLLEAASKRGAVFAVNTSAPAVAAVDVPIDLLVAIEALDVTEPMRAAAAISRAVAVDLTAHPNNFDIGVPRRTTFLPVSPQFHGLAEAIGHDNLAYGGSVATAAFALAYRLGADPIVLLGQDLAYTDGRGYASGTLFESTTVRRDGPHLIIDRAKKWDEMTEAGGLRVPSKRRPAVDVPAWGGEGTVWSTHELVLFRRWFEDAARAYRGRVELVNATEGGASIEGFSEERLESLLARLPERTHLLHEAMDAGTTLSSEHVARVRRGIATRAERLVKAATRTAKRARAGHDTTRDAEQVRAAAELSPLCDAHAAAELLHIMDDDRLEQKARTVRTFETVARSARRVSSLAGSRARKPQKKKRARRRSRAR